MFGRLPYPRIGSPSLPGRVRTGAARENLVFLIVVAAIVIVVLLIAQATRPGSGRRSTSDDSSWAPSDPGADAGVGLLHGGRHHHGPGCRHDHPDPAEAHVHHDVHDGDAGGSDGGGDSGSGDSGGGGDGGGSD